MTTADLVRRLRAARGGELPAGWEEALGAVDRAEFLPDRLWLRDGQGGYVPCERTADPDGWWEAAHRDVTLVTRLRVHDDGFQEPVSAASAPSTVLAMLEAADIHDGARVHEIGTGTGYHYALLAHRLGAERVTSVELDAGLAESARAALKAAGIEADIRTGDGAGELPAAPPDRIISTCSVRTLPPAWLRRTMPGARIVVPLTTSWVTYGTAVLTREADGTARGPVLPVGSYMAIRGTAAARADVRLADIHRASDRPARGRTALSPWRVAGDDLDALLAIGLRAPDIWHSWDTDPRVPGVATRLWLADDGATSWAAVDHEAAGRPDFAVSQHGPRRLWDEITTAHRAWQDAGAPRIAQHHLTATPHGHTVTTVPGESPSHT